MFTSKLHFGRWFEEMMAVLFIHLHDDDDDDDVPRQSPLQQPDKNFRNSEIGSGQT